MQQPLPRLPRLPAPPQHNSGAGCDSAHDDILATAQWLVVGGPSLGSFSRLAGALRTLCCDSKLPPAQAKMQGMIVVHPTPRVLQDVHAQQARHLAIMREERPAAEKADEAHGVRRAQTQELPLNASQRTAVDQVPTL
jgi:hypothetical protein